jgi:hypothetical protein
MSIPRILGAVALAAATQVSQAAPVNFSFGCITNSTSVCASVSPQMNVAVDKVDDATVSFTFTNVGSRVASVTEILWDTSLLSAITIFSQTDVIFGVAAPLPTLGGGQLLAPPFTADFAVTAPLRRGGQTGGTGSTPVENGIRSDQPADSLVVHGTLNGSYAAFLASLSSPAGGETRIGLNVNDIQSTLTASFIDSMLTEPSIAALAPAAVVPVPPALPLLAAGLLALGVTARRARKSTGG